jgi:P27 family predicted phage terminase small subunit
MPSGGHNRKPAELRRREGGSTVSHRPVPQTVVLGGRLDPQKFPAPPERLPEDGKDLWYELGPELAAVGLLDRFDLLAFEDLCRAHARKLQFGRVIAAKGPFAMGSRDQITQAAWTRAERAAADECARLYARFGLTPVDRTRLGLMHISGQSMARDLERALAPDEGDVDFVVVDDVIEGVGIPGLAL